MRIAQIILPGASLYERKSQALDAAALGSEHDVELMAFGGAADEGIATLPQRLRGFDLAHIYGPRILPRLRPGIPYVASGTMPRPWWARRAQAPAHVLAPVAEGPFTLLPEAVADAFFDVTGSGSAIGVVVRPSVKNVIEQTMHRLARTRDDVAWHLFDGAPEPDEMSDIAVWIDPAAEPAEGSGPGGKMEACDYDGFTAEALAAGRIVVASRTAINVQRTEKGRTGILVPQNDPNELTHAILSALFKPEAVQQRVTAARQTISKFRMRQRLRVLAHLYGTLF